MKLILKNHRYKYCTKCEFFREQGDIRCRLGFGKGIDDTGTDGKCRMEIAYEQGWNDRGDENEG